MHTQPSPYRAVNIFHLGYKNNSVYVIWINTKHLNTVWAEYQFLSFKPVGACKQ